MEVFNQTLPHSYDGVYLHFGQGLDIEPYLPSLEKARHHKKLGRTSAVLNQLIKIQDRIRTNTDLAEPTKPTQSGIIKILDQDIVFYKVRRYRNGESKQLKLAWAMVDQLFQGLANTDVQAILGEDITPSNPIARLNRIFVQSFAHFLPQDRRNFNITRAINADAHRIHTDDTRYGYDISAFLNLLDIIEHK